MKEDNAQNRLIYLTRDNIEKYIDDMVAIENVSFSQPWSRKAYLDEIRNNKLAHYVGCLEQGKLVAYGGFWLILDEGHISNIAVHPDCRGQGVGQKLVTAMAYLCVVLGGQRMTLEVRVSNAVAINLYKRLGFQSVGKRKAFYSDNQEDAYIMWLELAELREF